MSTQFTSGPTRDVQPGDTPDLNDGQLSRPLAVENIPRGTACFMDGASGLVTIGTTTLADAGFSPFVPVQTVDNSGDEGLNTSGVVAPQRVAVTIEFDTTQGLTLFPGDYLTIFGTTGVLAKWLSGTDAAERKYARFLGIEAALLDRDTLTPFGEELTPGVVPDQSVTGADGATFVGWVQLMENPGA